MNPLDIFLDITYFHTNQTIVRKAVMRRIRFVLLPFLFVMSPLRAQDGDLQYGMLIDAPAAKTLDRGSFYAGLRMYHRGGLLASVCAGITDQFSMGVSYGGENMIGVGDIHLNPQPGVQLSLILFNERCFFPAVCIGFDSQGFGAYDPSLKRYAVKSRGLYAVAGKNTSFLGGLGIHGGVNWSLEREDGDRDINLFAGCHKWITPSLVLLCEYDTGINDNGGSALGSGKGYLNGGIRWSFQETLFIDFLWKNIFENHENRPGWGREIRLLYMAVL